MILYFSFSFIKLFALFLYAKKSKRIMKALPLRSNHTALCPHQEKFLGTNSFALAFNIPSVVVVVVAAGAGLTVFLVLAGDAAAASPLLFFLVKAFA